MNILLIVVLAILAAAVIWGYWRGFVRIAFSLIAMLLMIGLVSWGTPYITEFLKENTEIYEDLTEQCARKIQEIAEEKTTNQISNMQDAENTGIQEKVQLTALPLPEVWVTQIMEEIGGGVNAVLEDSGIYRQIGEYIAEWIVRGISFFVAFLVTAALLKLTVGLLDIVAKLPLLKGVNRLLGCAAGLVQGLLFVWLLLFLVSIACTSQLGMTMLSYINESRFLTYLYQHNGIIAFVNYMFG